MIGRSEDKKPVMQLIRDTIFKIEDMEYPNEDSFKVAFMEMSRVEFFTMEDAQWIDEQEDERLKEIVLSLINPCATFINHQYYRHYKFPNKPYVQLVNWLGERSGGDLEFKKNIDLKGNRSKDIAGDSYSEMKLTK
jgi:hypothetical protein